MIRLASVYDTPGAERFLYELLRQRSVEDDPHVNISHRKLPSWPEHQAFIDSRPYRFWWLIQGSSTGAISNWENVGSLSVTERNEIGIVILRAFRGMGIGRQAVQRLLRDHEPMPAVPSYRAGRWLANINPANEASIKLFTGLGAVHIQNTYQL